MGQRGGRGTARRPKAARGGIPGAWAARRASREVGSASDRHVVAPGGGWGASNGPRRGRVAVGAASGASRRAGRNWIPGGPLPGARVLAGAHRQLVSTAVLRPEGRVGGCFAGICKVVKAEWSSTNPCSRRGRLRGRGGNQSR